MKPIVIQLQEELVTGNKKIAEQLRTPRLISAKLELPLVEDWIRHELEGYPLDQSKLPIYRIIGGGQLQFCNPHARLDSGYGCFSSKHTDFSAHYRN
jgi:AbiTii